MERKVYFRDYQEQTAGDHNNLQQFAQDSIDHLVADIGSKGRKYSGLLVTKTGQVEVTVGVGRVFDGGAVYGLRSSFTQSMATYTAAASKRIITLSAWGNPVDTDVQSRDYLTDVDTKETEPREVAMTFSRDVVLYWNVGTESASPVAPAIPANHVAVANITMDTTQVVSIEMLDNVMASTDDLDTRADSLEAFRAQIEPRVSSLASDLAALANEVRLRGQNVRVTELMQDMARVKDKLQFPAAAVDYGADHFLDQSQSDKDNASLLGYDCKIEEGIRFADANADLLTITLFSALDPNAKVVNNILLPAYTEVRKISTGDYNSDLGMAQYGYQTFQITQQMITRTRYRYGTPFTVCTNSTWWQTGTYDPVTGILRRYSNAPNDIAGDETFQVVDEGYWGDPDQWHVWRRVQQVWTDTYQEPYWSYQTTNYTITGAQIAQSFLVSNDMWATKFRFYVTQNGGNENINVTVCELTNGVPDLSKAILHQVYPYASIVVGWNDVSITPTFLKAGKRYALVLTSNANHKVGMAYGQSYVDGTFFYSTDSVYYQGDLTKDLMMEVWGAQFNSAQVTIEFAALNLDGGIRGVDIIAGLIAPQSTQLVWEVQPGGSGAWIPLDVANLTAFNLTPPLCRFRGRFIGTRDIAPAINLADATIKMFRPKTTRKHISTVHTLATPSTTIKVQMLYESFDEVPHDVSLQIYDVAGAAVVNPTATVSETLDTAAGRIQRTYTFTLGSPITTFRTIEVASTTSAGSTFHTAEKVYWSE